MDQYSKYKLFSKYILILKGGKMFPGNKNFLTFKLKSENKSHIETLFLSFLNQQHNLSFNIPVFSCNTLLNLFFEILKCCKKFFCIFS